MPPPLQVLDNFHKWLLSDALPKGWAVEEVNHEGWWVTGFGA